MSEVSKLLAFMCKNKLPHITIDMSKVQSMDVENKNLTALLKEACDLIRYSGLTTRDSASFDFLNKPEIQKIMKGNKPDIDDLVPTGRPRR